MHVYLPLFPFVQFKISVYGRKQTYTRVLQCCHASVGLAQARPNYLHVGRYGSLIMKYVHFVMHIQCTIACDRPFMDIQHFDGIVQCEHIFGTINSS